MVANESQSPGRLKVSDPAQPSTEGGRLGAIGGPNQIKKIARELQRLFQRQMDQLGECPLEDWSEVQWGKYRKRRARIQQLRGELQRLARPF